MELQRIASKRSSKTILAIALGFSQVANPSRTMAQYVLGPPADAPLDRTQARPTQIPATGMMRIVPRKPIDVSNRVEVVAPSIVELGVPVELPFRVKGGTLKTVITEQRQSKGQSGSPQPIPDAYNLNPLVVHDGKQFVRVTPARLGKVQVRMFAAFTDGGLTNKYVMLRVMPSREPPSQFWFRGIGKSLTGQTPVLPLSMQHPVGGKLVPVVEYADARAELRVDDHFVEYSTRSNPSTGVIDFDPRRGTYMPVGLGHALVTGNYAGITISVCIVVGQNDFSWRLRENCSDVQP